MISPIVLRYPTYYNSQASTYRADYSIIGQVAFTTLSSIIEVNTTTDLAKL